MGTIIVAVIVSGILAMAAYSLYKDKKRSKGSCCGSGGCSDCGKMCGKSDSFHN
ncbi:MAG: FeoB-associated Cys-rich membrane protein [Lachnospiraceae bacterium]|jgi:hypothetical protein|nr:FeoB-associated Cys-rich membrane protein [Lachnospiraceae bacterium]